MAVFLLNLLRFHEKKVRSKFMLVITKCQISLLYSDYSTMLSSGVTGNLENDCWLGLGTSTSFCTF